MDYDQFKRKYSSFAAPSIIELNETKQLLVNGQLSTAVPDNEKLGSLGLFPESDQITVQKDSLQGRVCTFNNLLQNLRTVDAEIQAQPGIVQERRQATKAVLIGSLVLLVGVALFACGIAGCVLGVGAPLVVVGGGVLLGGLGVIFGTVGALGGAWNYLKSVHPELSKAGTPEAVFEYFMSLRNRQDRLIC